MAFAALLCTPWNDDDPADVPVIASRLRHVLANIAADAAKRLPPTVAMSCEWHRTVYQGLTIPEPYYAGEVRDNDPRFPCLIGYDVRVGMIYEVPAMATVFLHLLLTGHPRGDLIDVLRP